MRNHFYLKSRSLGRVSHSLILSSREGTCPWLFKRLPFSTSCSSKMTPIAMGIISGCTSHSLTLSKTKPIAFPSWIYAKKLSFILKDGLQYFFLLNKKLGTGPRAVGMECRILWTRMLVIIRCSFKWPLRMTKIRFTLHLILPTATVDSSDC